MNKLITFCFVLFFSISNAQLSDFKNINFSIADNRAKRFEGASLKRFPLLCHNLTTNLPTEVEKFRAIYTWVSNNIKVDSQQFQLIMRKHRKFQSDSLAFNKWSETYRDKFFKKLLKKRTICTGYAYLVKRMAKTIGLECEIVNGYGRTVDHNIDTLKSLNHSWNAVKLNNKWYLCDATWSSGYLEDNKFINNYNDGFFLVSPKIFATMHYPLRKKWFLGDSITSKEFTTAPLLYSDAFKYKISPVLPKTMKIEAKNKQEIQFEFTTQKPLKTIDVSLVYFRRESTNELKIYNISNKDNRIKFSYKFTSRGIYDIHLRIKEDIVVSYSVKVSK